MYDEFQTFVMSRMFPKSFQYDYETVMSDITKWYKYSIYPDLESFVVSYSKLYQEFLATHKPIALAAVTISPDDRQTPETCLKIIDVLKTIKPFSKGMFIIEQREEDPNNPGGFHLHGTVESRYQPGKVEQFILQKMKTKKIRVNIKVKRINNLEGWNRYMEGGKEEEKLLKVQNDRIIREKFGLEEKYIW